MGAAAAAPRAAAAAPRRAPATKPAPRRQSSRRKRPNPALAGVARLPHAAARTAGAVRDISDSSLIMRLTRGRGWIALLGALLFGIVALNVISLSLTAGNGRIGAEIDAVERHNSALRAELAEQFSASRVEGAAAELGLAVPDPQDVRYVNVSDANVERLTKLLGTESFLAAEPSGYPDSSESVSYEPPAVSAAAPATSPSPAPATAAPTSAAPASTGGGGTGGTGGVGL